MKDQYNIKINPHKLDTNSIEKHMDFEAVLEKFNSQLHVETESPKYGRLKYLYIGITSIAAVIALLFIARGLFERNSEMHSLALNRPFKKFSLPYTQYELNADTGDTIRHSSGSIIVVPATAFVDKKGKPINGKVKIEYREFDGPVDMFIEGVPGNTQNNSLQTAGLMQINGFKDGEPVFISNDKELSVELKSTVTNLININNLKAYTIKDSKNDWEVAADVEVEILSENLGLEEKNDTVTPLNSKANDKDAFFATLDKKYPKPKRPLKPLKGAPKGMTAMGIEFNISEFPELAQYENVDWFAPKAILDPLPEEGWNNVSVKRISESKYEIVMTPSAKSIAEGRKEVRFEAFPLVPYTQKSIKDYDRAINTYNLQLEERNEIIREELVLWELANEKFAQINDNIIKKDQQNSFKTIVCRFAIGQFGIWNSANIFNMEQIPKVQSDFIDTKGNPIDISKIYISDSKRQLFYESNDFKNLAFDVDNADMRLWAMDKKGVLYVSNSSPNKENYIIKFKMYPAVISTESDLRKILTS